MGHLFSLGQRFGSEAYALGTWRFGGWTTF
jgi:hypothetical protein